MEDTNQKKVGKIDSYFGVTKSGSTIKTEILAGIVTFLAMCYILTLNPTIILGSPENPLWGSVFIATALGAVIGTLLMAFLAKMPLAQASGLGLNNMVCNAMLGFLLFGKKYSFGAIMLLVFISGILFSLLSVIPYKRNKETGKLITLREAIYIGMPKQLRSAISVGIGLFITIIGLANCGIIGSKDNINFFTLVDLLAFNNPANWQAGGPGCTAVVFLVGLLVITLLSHFKVKGAVIIGILAATVLAIPLGVANLDVLTGNGGVKWEFWENFTNFFSLSSDKGGTFFVLFTEGFDGFPEGSLFGSIVIVITFAMIDMFDTMGTVVGCCRAADLMDEDGVPLNYNKIMLSDSIATCAGAVLGTSTVTTFVESGSGVAAGGKTGLTALSTAVLFILSIFLLPLFAFIPSAACSAALVYVGVLMLGGVRDIDFTDIKSLVPAFITIVFMPFGYSITDGIGLGVITYVIIALVVWIVDLIKFKAGKLEEKPKLDVSIVLLVIFALFLVYFLVPTNLF